ncbi:hypothetical protein P8631_08010 [Guyparkeria sp. 1SP6A2]|nr:hypothetical protein [Guyparkeria sp. 1SP6A2]
MGCLLAALLTTGCANVTRFDAGRLTAFGEPLERPDVVLYYLIRLDARAISTEALPRFTLQMPGAEAPVPLADLTPSLTAAHLAPSVPPPQWPDTWKEKARQTTAFEEGGFYLAFQEDGSLAFLSICSHCSGGRETPVLCGEDGHPCHAVPLTQSRLIEIVGPPDRVRKVIEVTY